MRSIKRGPESELGMLTPVYKIFRDFTNLGLATYSSGIRATMKLANDTQRTQEMIQ